GLRRVPGPKGWAIIGHGRLLSDRPQRELKAWAKQYGELFQIRLGIHKWLYINSVEASRDIMDRQSAHTSSRVPSPVSNDVVGGDMRFVLMPDNAKWSFWRRTTHKILTPYVSVAYLGSQELEAKQLAYDCLMDNKNETGFYQHVRRFATSVIMSTTYGWRLPTAHCEDIEQIYSILHELSESSVPGTWIADSFPFLAKLPSWAQWWRKAALKHFEFQERAWMKYWHRIKANVEAGKSPGCFSKQLIEDNFQLTELEKGFLAGSLVEAGAETTSTTLNSCFRYLALNPSAQAKAHAELDRVVGRTRFPTWADQGSLPYIEACHRETARLRPPTNNGVLHYTTADIRYKDYHIPAGTVVAMNTYALYYDPARYPEPEAFRPERFLTGKWGPSHDCGVQKYVYSSNANDLPDRWGFGAGKKIYPGMHFAVNSLYIALARLLWAFELKPPLDQWGNEVELDVSDEGGYKDRRFTVPREYSLRFVPRFEGVEEMVRKEWVNANPIAM
ncbi:hypothetical protein MMC22_012054, partial [Lobaria immixta]|nr:hypothetical protein [Lobaria immixta]